MRYRDWTAYEVVNFLEFLGPQIENLGQRFFVSPQLKNIAKETQNLVSTIHTIVAILQQQFAFPGAIAPGAPKARAEAVEMLVSKTIALGRALAIGYVRSITLEQVRANEGMEILLQKMGVDPPGTEKVAQKMK